MRGFDIAWLALREKADRQARSTALLDEFRRHMERIPSPGIMDIGCGTGSTYRTLSPVMPTTTAWRLVDYETALLAEAERQIGAMERLEYYCRDINHLEETLLENVSMVTASALFDLCSAAFCDHFVERLSRHNIGLYAALNYDGMMTWSVEHPLDEHVVNDFNLHQRTDKGFGPALGPDASGHLRDICERAGYVSTLASSPWRLGPDAAELQTAFLMGLERPVLEVGRLSRKDMGNWLEFRLSKMGVSGSLCIVGHTDLLALPRL